MLSRWFKRGHKVDISQYIHILQCPVTKEPLHLNPEKTILINESNTIAYPINDDVPDFWPESAIDLGKVNFVKKADQN